MAASARWHATREDRCQVFSRVLTAGLINHDVFGNQAVFDMQDSIHALKGLGHGVAI